MGLKMQMFFLGLKLARLAWWAWRNWAQLVVGLTLLGSGVVMKLAPAFDVLSLIQAKLPVEVGLKAFQEDITSAYASFVKVPYLKEALAHIGLDAHSFMVALSIFDLMFAFLVLLAKGRRPAQLAGTWMMVEMAGAEYCVRKSGMYMSSVKELPHYEFVMSSVHVYIFYEAFKCLRCDAVDLSGWVWSFLPASSQACVTTVCAKTSGPFKLAWAKVTGWCKKAADTAKRAEERAVETAKKIEGKVEERGRAVLPGGSSKNRTSTPVPGCKKST
ncbi:unnamed protein product [Prorocentrum cordatum]|uniref:Uncharacterized protein n=1 Tax=Prorocentrum cordatum TaxID=2364126 RepID=A0ABN9UXF8_9DINO|nr:unnamed protein product [Polarella glacialis]